MKGHFIVKRQDMKLSLLDEELWNTLNRLKTTAPPKKLRAFSFTSDEAD